jgi:hypothetical protein
LHTGCGCIGHPAFPTPSKGAEDFGRKICNNSGAMRSESVESRRHDSSKRKKPEATSASGFSGVTKVFVCYFRLPIWT